MYSSKLLPLLDNVVQCVSSANLYGEKNIDIRRCHTNSLASHLLQPFGLNIFYWSIQKDQA